MAAEHEIIALMERIVGGDPIADSEVMVLAGANFSPVTGAAWHLLCHWISDADIRARDPSYEAGQLEQIRAQLRKLQRE